MNKLLGAERGLVEEKALPQSKLRSSVSGTGSRGLGTSSIRPGQEGRRLSALSLTTKPSPVVVLSGPAEIQGWENYENQISYCSIN